MAKSAWFACFIGALAVGVMVLAPEALAEEETMSPEEELKSIKWETNEDYDYIGDPAAKKGGLIRSWWNIYPPTLRTEGPQSNLMQLSQIQGYMYESLLSTHPTTLEFMPNLATHWSISDDKMTFWFKIDPDAKWADGTPVTADDVVATYEHMIDPDIKDPFANWHYTTYWEKPVALSKDVVKVRCLKLNWRLFYYFGGMAIYPAKQCRIPGEKYLKEYQWKLWMGSGPYYLKEEDLKKEESFVLTRRTDYWAENKKFNKGLNNFDRIRWIVIRDDTMAFESFKKGDLDFFAVGRAQRWHEECDFEKIQNGWIQKRKIYNQRPIGFSGFVFNMRKPPFDDIKVRKAFCHLFNRQKLMDKLFFNEYDFTDSYYPGREWGNPDNPKVRYDPGLAASLLAEAGFKKRNKEGWLVGPDGKVFELTLEYGYATWTRIHTVIKEDYEKAGIKFNLKLLDGRALYQKMQERKFKIAWQGWGAILFPNPESSWRSNLADELHNNNVPGFKSRKVDKLCEKYNVTFDRKEQIEIIREIDGIIFKKYSYALGWHASHTRILYWDRLGHPKEYFSRVGDSRSIISMWWFEPEKDRALIEAMQDDKKLPRGEMIQKPWKDYGKMAEEQLK